MNRNTSFTPTFLLGAALLATQPVSAEVIHIGNAETQELLKQGVTIVDIRTPGEWKQTGVVAGSQLVQFVDEKGRYDAEQFMLKVNAVADPSKPVVLICRSGNRTRTAAQLISSANPQRKVYNVKEGLIGWNKSGLPMVSLEKNLQTAGVRCTPAC
jgi:rhodanese-related sulfurtransferase